MTYFWDKVQLDYYWKEGKIVGELTETTTVKDALGRIVAVKREKGYVFISSKDIPFQRIFCHWSRIRGLDWEEVEYGMEVKFDAEKDTSRPKGEQWRAMRAHVITNGKSEKK